MTPGDLIFLSASVPVREEWTAGSNPLEIQQAIVSLARAVFSRGGRLLFGGHPSISPLIADIAGEYYPPDPERKVRPIVTFQSKLYEGKLPDQTWLLFQMGWSAIEWTPNIHDDKNASLSYMRRVMLQTKETPAKIMEDNQLTPPVAMFAVGGMEGIRDEALLFLEKRMHWPAHQNARIFALTSGGGASARLFEPPHRWPDILWPDKTMPPADEAALIRALESDDLIALEQAWESAHPRILSSDMPLQPYGAITQWALDEVINES